MFQFPKVAQKALLINSNGSVIKEIELPEAAKFVGVLETDEVTTTACLLEDGTIFTPFHGVFDLNKFQYRDLSDCTVTFVANGNVFCYGISQKPTLDGLKCLEAGSSQFEYAILTPKGSPVKDLSGGLSLDETDHFSGMVGSNEPNQTLAISKPEFVTNVDGDLQTTYYISLSDNSAATSQHYMFNAEGSHYTLPGFSGQAVLRYDNSKLYAVHIGREKNCSVGIKMSEYLYSLKGHYVKSPEKMQHTLNAIKHHLTMEGLRRKGADISDIKNFFLLLKKASENQTGIQGPIPNSLLAYNPVDSHQKQHLKGSGYVKGKAYFYPWLITSDASPVMQALASSVTKIVSHYYQQHLKTTDPVLNRNRKLTIKFIVDLGVYIGIDVKSGAAHVHHVMIDGFSGTRCHVYPVDPQSPLIQRGVQPTLIDAQALLEQNFDHKNSMYVPNALMS